MAVPRKDTLAFLGVCLATYAMAEYLVITRLVQPVPSTRRDWQLATLFIAPMSATSLLLLAAFTTRIVLGIWTFLRFVGQLISGARR